jgi:hypothetical protein
MGMSVAKAADPSEPGFARSRVAAPEGLLSSPGATVRMNEACFLGDAALLRFIPKRLPRLSP